MNDSGRRCIEIWGDGTQSRSFCYVDDCVEGIGRIMHSEELAATTINLGLSELITISLRLQRTYDLRAPGGRGRLEQR